MRIRFKPGTCSILLVAMSLATVAAAGPVPPARRGSTTLELLVTSAQDSGPGTLRQAILDANGAARRSSIRFDIDGALPVRIRPVTALPETMWPIVIDATTEPGYDGSPVIELHSDGDTSVGLTILGPESTVRGLVVNGFSNAGVRLAGSYSVVESCYIGTDATGTAAIPNAVSGIEVTGENCRIGGASTGAGNLVSGNGGFLNTGGGVFLNFAGDAVLEGNAIGTDVTRSLPLGNAGAGVRSIGSLPFRVGGTEPGSGNVIAYNARAGIYRDTNLLATVLGNSIYGNGDAVNNGDGRYGIHCDTGYFSLQPLLVSVSAGAPARVKGALAFGRSSLFGFGPVRFEIFRNVDCSENGFGQGKEFLGAVEVERSALQTVTFEFDVAEPLGPGETFTCTATTPTGSTSPYSNCLGVTGSCELPFNHFGANSTSVISGQRVTLEAEVSGSEPIAYQWFEFPPGQGPTTIQGATQRTYEAFTLDAFTRYEYTATNACGSARGAHTVVPCVGPPVIVTEPVDSVAIAGSLGRLSVEVPLGSAVEYQWYEGLRGDVSRPVAAQMGIVGTLVFASSTATATYWCRVSNACGFVDSKAATLMVLPAMLITSVEVKVSASGKQVLLARGSGIPGDVRVQVGAFGFEKAARSKPKKITQRGDLGDGRSIDEAIPIGATTQVRFISASKGTVEYEVTR